ncbi:phage portal protein [Agrococcus sp. DT81.2]|uniref:phage portal protein n=1 Tax=Agrococcus sp. DT81.2 TaxID=3393414 RepID=UPI003CE55DED
MKQNSVVELANDLLIPGLNAERSGLDKIDAWYRWDPEHIDLPRKAGLEQQALRGLSETPWLGLVVTTIAQQLVAELVRSSEVTDTSAIWQPWLRNRMQSRQRAIHRAALAYGYAYTTVMPGDQGAVIRGYSPRDMYAVYQDPVVDEYPMYYVRKIGNRYVVVDDTAAYTLVETQGTSGPRMQYVSYEEHGVGVAPAIRYSNQIDLEGRTPGEVEPFIDMAKRINKTSFDRMLAQHFNSWKVRTATGLDEPGTPEEQDAQKLILRQNDILVGGEGVTFGSLPETSLDGFIKAWESDVEALAAVSQTPAHSLTGKMINLSADAITEARSILDLKANERKLGFGDSHAQTLRLASHVEGRERDAADFTLSIQWADLGSRSLSQAADALGKIASQLGVPAEKLWDRIPGVSAEDVTVWLKWREAHPPEETVIASALRAQISGSDSAG